MRNVRLLALLVVAACAAPEPEPVRDLGDLGRIQAMQEHLESLRARGAIHPEKYDASKAQLDEELRKAQRR
jgi:hypothetical protein